jgi:ferredoxin
MRTAAQDAGAPDEVRAIVDHDLCAGVTQCLRMAPGAFQLDEDQLSVFAPSGPWTFEQLAAARDNCPMAAIILLAGPGRATLQDPPLRYAE